MLADIVFGSRTVIFQIIALRFGHVPFGRKHLIVKIGFIDHFVVRNILDEIPQVLSDILKFMNTRVVEIVRVQKPV